VGEFPQGGQENEEKALIMPGFMRGMTISFRSANGWLRRLLMLLQRVGDLGQGGRVGLDGKSHVPGYVGDEDDPGRIVDD
jgi:hypothetical protein